MRYGSLLIALIALAAAGCPSRRHAPAPPAAPQTFTDVTAAAGIAFRHVNGATGELRYPETFGAGGGFIDYDGDGWLDIVLVNGDYWPGHAPPDAKRPTLALYRNRHDGTFEDVTQKAGLDVSLYGMGLAVADYDNDGHDDLFVTGLDHCLLFQNRGDGTFDDVTKAMGVGNEGHWATSAAWLDYDNDGQLDLVVGNYVRYRPESDIVCHAGARRIYCGPLVYPADSCRLFHNRGGGRGFADATKAAGLFKTTGKPLGIAIWDIDGDRFPDILVANDLTPNYLFHNNRNGTFTEIGTEAGIAYGADGVARSGMGIDAADIRGDGKCAIFISNFAREPNSLFVEEAPRVFGDRTFETGMGEASLQALGFGLFFFDYDNDGFPDAFVTNGHIQPQIAEYEAGQTFEQPPLLFHNRGDGTFDEVSRTMGEPMRAPFVGRGAACGDFDNDGDPDILITGNDRPAHLLRNDGGNRAHWLTIRLIGTKSNKNGIGAEVRVSAGGRTRRDQARSGSSYLSARDLRLHFGLGKETKADRIEVRWPDGAIDRLDAVPADQSLTLTEGQTHALRR